MTSLNTLLRRLVVTACLTLALLGAGLVAPTHAATEVESYLVQARVDVDGSLGVRATITPRGGEGEIVQRFATTQATTDGREFHYTLDGLRVTRDGAEVGASVSSQPGHDVVTIPVTDERPVVLEYTVRGAAVATDDSTTLVWRLLQGLNLPVRTFEATVSSPVPFAMIDCAAGAPGSPGACAWYQGGTHENADPTFHDGPRGAGEIVQIVVRFNDGVAANQQVVHRWSLDRAFSLGPLPLGLAALAAVAGLIGLWLASRRLLGPASGGTPAVVGTFRPVGQDSSEFQVSEGIRPGHLGTLKDGHVDPVDVTATLIDLAVHGSLLIRELPRRTAFARGDWEFVRREGGRPLLDFEQTLLDAVAPTEGHPVTVSRLGEAVTPVLGTVQDQLYDDVVRHGWFGRRPDAARAATSRLGWGVLAAALVVAGLLIAFTTFGVLGLVLVALAAAAGWVAQGAPLRNAKGSRVLDGLGLLRGQLLTQPTDEMPAGAEVTELSEVLPYAVVLGGADRWLDGLAATDLDADPDETDLAWFHGPSGWHLSDLPDSLRNFVTSVEGHLLAR